MEKWIVAVSGGPDSMALLDMMRVKGYECIVAHVNYNKRASSIRDENIVREYCDKFNILYEVLSVKEYPKGNFQDIARKIRYDLFKSLVLKYQAVGVMTAHHLDDSLETYVMNRENNKESSSIGIAEIAYLGNLKVYRPLLEYQKHQLVDYCDQYGIDYGVDESNSSLQYTRNKVRYEISLLNDKDRSELIQELRSAQSKYTNAQKSISLKVADLDTTIDHESLSNINELRSWLTKHDVNIYSASKAYLEEMFRNLKSNKGYYNFESKVVYAQYGKIYIDELRPFNISLNALEYGNFKHFELRKEGTKIESINVNEDDFPITFRNPLPGDKIKLRLGTKQVNRFFIDNKIPLVERKNWLVVENRNKDIVFVVGIGCDIHHYSNNSNLFVIK